MNRIERLVEQWRAAGIELGPPASPSELRALERLLGASLPADVATFYKLANGMPDREYDRHEVSFWSIPRILAERKSRGGVDPNGTFVDLVIADFLVDSWFFDLRARDGTVTVFVEGSQEELQSLSALATRYIEAPDSLLIL